MEEADRVGLKVARLGRMMLGVSSFPDVDALKLSALTTPRIRAPVVSDTRVRHRLDPIGDQRPSGSHTYTAVSVTTPERCQEPRNPLTAPSMPLSMQLPGPLTALTAPPKLSFFSCLRSPHRLR